MRLSALVLSYIISYMPTAQCQFRNYLRKAYQQKVSSGNHRKLTLTNSEDGIIGSYIVHMKDNTSDEEVEQTSNDFALQTGGKIRWIYKELFKGFSITDVHSEEVLTRILDNDSIDEMDQDIAIHLEHGEYLSDGADEDFIQTGDSVSNGLDRIDQVNLPLDKTYTYRESGKGVTVFILDTGISLNHIDFEGRAKCGFDTFTTSPETDDDFFDPLVPPPICNDTARHGSHVAGIIGGMISGVAKKTELVSVKVISENGGSASQVLAGLEYVRLRKIGFPTKPMVVNMSLGSIYSKSINRAVDRLVDSNVTVVAAAGNRHVNACLSSPASSKRAITVGATTTTRLVFKNRDRRALYSNWGRCVDIFAPGTRIRSVNAINRTRYGINTGTSMAAPHVTGAIALYLERDPKMTPDQIREKLLNDALDGKLMTIFQKFSPNKLLHVYSSSIPQRRSVEGF